MESELKELDGFFKFFGRKWNYMGIKFTTQLN